LGHGRDAQAEEEGHEDLEKLVRHELKTGIWVKGLTDAQKPCENGSPNI
jgi:hypothetical protein